MRTSGMWCTSGTTCWLKWALLCSFYFVLNSGWCAQGVFTSSHFPSLLPLGLSPLFGDRRLHPHPEYSHCAYQDPALLPQSPEPGPSTGVPCPQDLPRGEGKETRPLCLSNGVTQHCVLFSSLWSLQLTWYMMWVWWYESPTNKWCSLVFLPPPKCHLDLDKVHAVATKQAICYSAPGCCQTLLSGHSVLVTVRGFVLTF